jgi:CubicO group peptidase (beta-lactamase class C family)
MVIEKVSGESYPHFLSDRIFAPLALKSTSYNDGTAQIPVLARPYVATANGPQPTQAENADWAFAAGAIATTASDLTRWDDQLRGRALLNDASLLEMFTPGTLDNGTPTDYAFGWVVVKHDGVREIWHNGEVTGYHAMNAMYPDAHTDVVVLTNTGGTFAADKLAVQIFDLLHPYRPTAADRAATGRATEWLGRIQRGDIDRTQLTAQLDATLTDAIAKAAGAQLRAFGRMKSVKLTSVDEDSSGRSYAFKVAFAKQSISWVMGVDKQGKISALYFHL